MLFRSKLRAEFRSNRPVVPEAVRQEVQSKLRRINQNRERTGNNSLEAKPNIVPLQKIESPKAESPNSKNEGE